MKSKPQKPYWEMTTAELREATKEFDDPNYDPPAITPPADELKKLHRAMRKPGRPRNGLGAKTIALSVERGLLDRSDRLAKKHGLTRAQLVALGLQGLLNGKLKIPRPSERRRKSSAA